jgi:microcystin-dependent protein
MIGLPLVDNTADADKPVSTAQAAAINRATPVGAIAFFAMSGATSGWLKANGAAVSRTVYAALFTTIGTVFGVGDGTTTFNLPDLRGEFPRGWDDGRGVDTARAFGSSQTDGLKSHAHVIDGRNNATAFGSDSTFTHPTGSGGDNVTGSTGAIGGTETRPRNIALQACIKY